MDFSYLDSDTHKIATNIREHSQSLVLVLSSDDDNDYKLKVLEHFKKTVMGEITKLEEILGK